MLKLILAEIQYNWIVFSLLVPLTLILVIYETYDPEYSSYYVYFIVLLLISGVYTNRRLENRDRQLLTLPVSSFDMGLARIAVLLIGIALTLSTYFLAHLILGDLSLLEWKPALVFTCLLIWIYSLLFIFVDLFPGHIKRVKGTAIAILFALTLSGVLVTIYIGSTGKQPEALAATFQFLSSINPFAGTWGMVRLMIATLALGFCTALTFKNRRSFV